MVIKMKTTIFREILDEEYIEVNKSVLKTIQHIIELDSLHSEPVRTDAIIICRCSKKGKITVTIYNPTTLARSYDNQYPLYYVYGQVISKDDKTYIHMTSVYKKSEIYIQCLWSILAVLLFPFICFSLLKSAMFNILILIISLLLGFFFTINERSSVRARKSRGLTMLPNMKNELRKIIETIEKWDN